MLHIEEYVGIIVGARQPHRTQAAANPAQPRGALFHELKRYIEAHEIDVDDVRIVNAIDTGRVDGARHWYDVTYEA
ncbi:hypothetical protein [Mycobacterium sherrisii]|uniref:Uncharacterized protein n=1 Tax=Mycobacterium sherrisii TaxID=243061 RepID=A0A1E3SKZ3_9MYCO|nr:hypothetical protein [Mycobacterium sherrisii]MCV7028333.1 hypothetical protein [Mycobacterium sherrisii]MEC4765026.1 hypothetical protein [Mycobacterium sherrisii]ODR02303.1 hypothetical protein BHQ21_22650 [Mycobacterium sherrisii]ORW87380.1 hypothetical protein AWC25_00675 [Mycobacterium sherrisii]